MYQNCGSGNVLVYVPNGGTAAGAPPLPPGAPAAPVITPADLANEARDRLRVPLPDVGLAPDNDPLQVLVQWPMYWWINNTAPVSARAAATPRVWAEATATPIGAILDPGDGEAEVDCRGLGVPWAPGMDNKNVPGDACTYIYRRAQDQLSAAVTVVWQVTWVGSDGSGGTLEPIEVTTEFDLAALERQVIGTQIGG